MPIYGAVYISTSTKHKPWPENDGTHSSLLQNTSRSHRNC